MGALQWDQSGERFYETGVKNGVLYVQESDGSYPEGIAWNGLTAVTESPSGAEKTTLWADDSKYLNLLSAEEFGGTIEAYTYPDKFGVCDGTGSLDDVKGLKVGQQSRRAFGFVYKTTVGNDIDGNDKGYKLHLVYGATASPSERPYSTINDSPEAISFSWEFSTVPVNMTGFKPTSLLTINSLDYEDDDSNLKTLENQLFGKDAGSDPSTDPEIVANLPLPDVVARILKTGA